MEDKYNCFLWEKPEFQSISKKYISKVIDYNIRLQNEISIKDELTKVFEKSLNKYFLFAESYEPIRFGYVDDSSILELELEAYNKYLVRYTNKKYTNIANYLKQSKSTRIYFRRLFNIFKNLLVSIQLLTEYNIIHTNLTKESIFLTADTDEPLIGLFQYAFIDSSKHSYNYVSNKKYMPPEYQLLCYKNTNKISTLSYSNISLVINNYYSSIKELYTRLNIVYPFIDLEPIIDYFKHTNLNTINVSSWNLYSITMMLFEIIVENVESINDPEHSKLLLNLFHLLEPNISPFHNKRMTIKQTYKAFKSAIDYELLLKLINY